jgi:predicted aconitase
MKLTNKEKKMLDGDEGPAKQKAMELIVRYGKVLGGGSALLG